MLATIRHIIKKSKKFDSFYYNFSEKISALESSGFYTPNVRIASHVLIWCILMLLYTLNIMFVYSTNVFVSVFFALRNVLGSMAAFYFIFYFLRKNKFIKRYTVLLAIGFLLPFWFWAAINYGFMVFISKHIYVQDKDLLASVKIIADKPFLTIISFGTVFKTSIGVLMVIAPAITIKLIISFILITTKTIRLERDNLALEVNFLKAQLNPHFLFNTLNNIYLLTMQNDPKGPELVLQLSDMMRYSLYESNTETVLLLKEINFLKDYVELERVRYNKNTVIEFVCDFDEQTQQHIAPLLMFPFVENAFKHGLNTSIENSFLKINIKADNENFVFDISNTKGSIRNTINDREKVGGIGIANTKKRLDLLYNKKHELTIIDTCNTYQVIIKIKFG